MQINNEMNSKIKELKKYYEDKVKEIIEKLKILEKEVKVQKLEINYYKGINDELIRQHNG